MTTNQRAIDIVLLPPPQLTNICFSLSQQLTQLGGEGLLYSVTAQPHITLAMAVIEANKLNEIIEYLSKKVIQYLPITLTIKRIEVNQVSENQNISSFLFNYSLNLISLHEVTFKLLKKYHQPDFDHQALQLSEPHPATENYIQYFEKESAFQNYDPHITLGFGSLPQSVHFPKIWEMSKIGIYQLGKNCTCTQLLWESGA